MAAVRSSLSWVFRQVVGIYFRELEAAGNVPGSTTKGRLFVANHVNAIVDPILVLTTAPCPISPVAKSTLWKMPVLRWLLDAVDAVPIVRRRDDPTKQEGSNEAVFDRVADWLAGGGNILIFPEGTSHNEPHLLAPKTGAGRMLARALERGASEVTLQAVALEFDARDTFRSRCLLLYGPVRRIADLGASGDALVQAITEQLQIDLTELLVEGATWEERVLVARVAEMLAHDAGERSLTAWNDIGRQVEAAKDALARTNPETIARIESAVSRYYDRCAEHGVDDALVTEGSDPRAPGRSMRAAFLTMLLPLAMVGMVLFWLPYQLPRFAASRVKDRDEVSTYKLATGLLVFPLWAAALVVACFALIPAPARYPAAASVVAAPFAALAWLDRSARLRAKLRILGGRAPLDELKAARAEAMALVAETRQRLAL